MSLDAAITDQISHAIQTVQEREDIEGEIHVHVSKKRIKIDPINAFALCFTGSLSVRAPTAVLVPWLRHLTRHGDTVPAGTVVTTGTWCGLLPVTRGERVTVRFDGFEPVTVTV